MRMVTVCVVVPWTTLETLTGIVAGLLAAVVAVGVILLTIGVPFPAATEAVGVEDGVAEGGPLLGSLVFGSLLSKACTSLVCGSVEEFGGITSVKRVAGWASGRG